MQWFAQAPSNIALIKYMGKKDEEKNIPENASLSYTLNKLLSSVKLETAASKKDFWEPLMIPGVNPIRLSAAAQQRFLAHLAMLKAYFDYKGGFVVRSANNFPLGSGLASSASSFAALTKCSIMALCELTGREIPPFEEQIRLSRLGSGSSCRSFYSPWALWKGEEVVPVELPYKQFIHQVIVISHEEKTISSSEAHKRVQTSPQYIHRAERAEANLKLLLNALNAEDWEAAYHVCWKEFQDMHHLFSSCEQPFTYMTEQTLQALKAVQTFWETESDGPIVTMDAGPNIHLLYREDQAELATRFKQWHLIGNYDVL